VSTAVRPIAELEAEAILGAVSALGGNKLEAARQLGIGKATLYRKLKEFTYTIPAGDFAPTLLLRQAAALRTIPSLVDRPEKKAVRFLKIPSTKLEQERASLRCPGCGTRLVDEVVSA
jgi:hypothetical protein